MTMIFFVPVQTIAYDALGVSECSLLRHAPEELRASRGGDDAWRWKMPAEALPITGEIIDRLSRGDVVAAKELTGRFYERISRIASAIYLKSYGNLRGRHDLESILGEAWVRLMRAIERTHPRSADDVYKLAVRHVRFTFIDVIKKQRREDARRVKASKLSNKSGVASFDPGSSTLDPARLALWTELQGKLAGLPAGERQVFLLHGMGDCTQAEIARTMGLPPYKVSRLWLSASGKMADSIEAIRDRV
jgi:RNA polymerase sigma factor (sigma-70 family)